MPYSTDKHKTIWYIVCRAIQHGQTENTQIHSMQFHKAWTNRKHSDNPVCTSINHWDIETAPEFRVHQPKYTTEKGLRWNNFDLRPNYVHSLSLSLSVSQTHTHTYIHTRTNIHTHANIHTQTHTHTRTHTRTHTHARTCSLSGVIFYEFRRIFL